MTDLTEQWKKGELTSGWYYTKLWKGCNVIDYFIGNQFLRYDDSDIDEVLAPVPSYEEWKEYQELDEDNKKNMQLAIRFSIEADILRELLKEIRQQITEQVFGSPELQLFEGTFDNKLLAKIDEVLK